MHVCTPVVSHGTEEHKNKQQMLVIKAIKDDYASHPLEIRMIVFSSAMLKTAFYIGC